MSLKVAKNVLRKELKSRLKNMTSEERSSQSYIIFKKLLQNKRYINSHRISIYLSRDIEVDTYPILQDIFNSGKFCFIPRYDPNSTQMNMVKLNSLAEYQNLPLTSWNIKQPTNDDPSQDEALSGGLDLMIVPGIGFTKQGHRIGNGKGYYDIYLQKYKEKFGETVPTIALAYKEQMVTTIPTDETDIVIDEVISSD